MRPFFCKVQGSTKRISALILMVAGGPQTLSPLSLDEVDLGQETLGLAELAWV